jgi:ATP-dependent helicase/nuclease subunit B
MIGNMDPGTAIRLYGDTVPFSATKTDTFGKCRLSYFLRYGVKAKVRKPAEVDPAEFGTFIHAVLEDLGIRILELGGFKAVSLDDTLALAESIAKEYIADHFGQIDSQRTAYLLKKNGKQLAFIVTDWWQEMQTSQFQPAGFELSFGDGKIFDAIEVCGKNLRAKLEGFVDRVDIWQKEDKVYFRVVDYKTGKKAFDYCDVFNGMGMQMLLYLFALEQNGQSLLGDQPVPAGVLYVPARADYISAANDLDEETAAAERIKLQRRSGLLLDDEEVLSAMEPVGAERKLPVQRDKEGNFKGDMATKTQLNLLKRYITLVLERMADDIAAGKADANPYTRGSSFDACAYCDYNQVCCGKRLENRRDYKAVTSDDFWKYVEKELSDYGR